MDAVDTEIHTVVEREIFIAAKPLTVWQLLVDPRQMIRWMGLSAVLDPRPGGTYRVEVIPGRIASGQVVEVVAPRRLVHTWGWEDEETTVPAGSTTVTFELVPHDDGTLLRLTHSDLPHAAAAASHARGWQHYLERLTMLAGGSDPAPDPWITGALQ
jgi:uncharacterized protein YndB with AHSA1/START domain